MSRRSYLATLISNYNNPRMQLLPEERRSIEQLECIYLNMETKRDLPLERRKISLNSIRTTYQKADFPDEDKSFYLRMSLLQSIKNEALDPQAALRDSKAASCNAR